MEDRDLTKQRIGIIGGGQLGKMMILEAKKMGFYVNILDPTPDCSASSIADYHITADFDDEVAIRELARISDVLTYEFEHINVSPLKELEGEGYKIYPTAKSLEVIQDKYQQNQVLAEANIPLADFRKIESIDDIKKVGEEFSYPMMLKSCTGGYDGKGNCLIDKVEEVEDAYRSLGGDNNFLMLERFVSFTKEISVLACRGIDGEIAVYPVGENEHQNSILVETKVPAEISEELTQQAMKLAHDVMEVFQGVGMFCVEMFVTDDNKLLVNEVAPRPHNSGHYTIEGCVTSQFEQHIRAVSGLPLGDTELLRPTVMRNILGEDSEGNTLVLGASEALKAGAVQVHIYGKSFSKVGRKMGHLTVTASTLIEAIKNAENASRLIKIIGKED